MAKLTIDGLDELQAKLKGMSKLDAAKRIVKQNGSELQQKAQNNAQFRGHYEGSRFVKPTGNLRRNIKGPNIIDGGLTAEVPSEADYSMYVEYGTRFMAAQPFMRPAFDAQKAIFKNDLAKLVK